MFIWTYVSFLALRNIFAYQRSPMWITHLLTSQPQKIVFFWNHFSPAYVLSSLNDKFLRENISSVLSGQFRKRFLWFLGRIFKKKKILFRIFNFYIPKLKKQRILWSFLSHLLRKCLQHLWKKRIIFFLLNNRKLRSLFV